MVIGELDDEIRNLFAKAALAATPTELAAASRQLRAALYQHVGETGKLTTGSLRGIPHAEGRQRPH
jgi:hypothetical protein